MLRRLKQQVSQVANELPGALAAVGDRNSSRDEPVLPQANEDGEIEGFLCPICMTHFGSPDQLSSHFDKEHNTSTTVDNPNFDNASNGVSSATPSFRSKEHEIDELKLQLKEEKIFSLRLKEELDRIQNVVAQVTDVPTEEVPYLMQQIQVLEAGKSMVTQRMLEFEKEATQSKRSLENSTQERNDIMAKLKQQSQQIRELMDQNETFKNERDVLSENIKKSTSQAAKLNEEIENLRKTLDQRPSEDDVAVLRTELVNAQKLMDDIAQQKDVEIEEHRSSIRLLNMERERENCVMENLKRQVSQSAESSTETNTIIEGLNNQVDDVRQLLETTTKELTSAQNSILERENRIIELQSRLDANLVELTTCQDKIKQLEEVVESSAKEIDGSHSLNEKNVQKLAKLEETLGKMIEDKKKYEADFNGVEEKHQKQIDTIKSLEMSNLDLTNEVASLGSMLEQERSLITEKNQLIQNKDDMLHTIRGELDEFKRKIEKLESEKSELGVESEGLKKQIVSLESNSKELATKISEGEGGAKMMIDQLTADKQRLSEEIAFLASSIKEIKEEHSSKIEELEKKNRDKERTQAEKQQKAESELEELRRNLKESESELSRKSERFIEMEKELDDERQKASDRINKLKELVLQKEASVQQFKSQLEEMHSTIEEKNRQLKEKETHVEESKKRIEESVKHLEDAEAKARILEQQLQSSEVLLTSSASSEKELLQRLDEANSGLEKWKIEASQLAEDIKTKEDELAIISKEMSDKEEHWNSKKEEFLKQMEKNQEANDDLLTTINELKAKLESEETDKKNKESRIGNMESTINEFTARITELEASVDEKDNKIDELKKANANLEEEKAELQTSSTSLLEKNEETCTVVTVLESTVANHQKEIEEWKEKHNNVQTDLETKLVSFSNENKSLLAQLEQKDEDLFRISQNMARLQSKLADKENETNNFNERISSFESELAGQKDILDDMENVRTQLSENLKMKEEELTLVLTEMKEKEDQFKIREADLNQIINVLQEEGSGLSSKIEDLSKFVAEKEETAKALKLSEDSYKQELVQATEQKRAQTKELESVQKELGDKIDTIKKLENKCAQFEKLAKEIQNEKDKELADRFRKIEELQEKLAQKESDSIQKEDELTALVERQKRSVQSLESEVDAVKAEVEQWKQTSQELTTQSLELQKQNCSWEEEKNALIERCLKTESDLEFERERSIENKRRFDDCLAAMHELGRANQSLQIDISKHTSRKWLDDSAAVNCTDCGKTFTLTFRKHHCRLCGLIFCAQCSDKTVSTASSKKPVRACNHCHTDAANR